MKKKLVRVSTVPQSLGGLLRGQLSYMSQHYDVLAISSNIDGFLTSYSKKENVRAIRIDMTRKITPIKDLKATWALYKILRKEKPFIVHTHTPKAGTLGMIAAYFARVPHRLHTIAGMPLLERKGTERKLLNLIEKITYRCATKVYPNSFKMMDIVLENKFTIPRKLKVVGNGSSNGVDPEYYNPNSYGPYRKERTRRFLNLKETDFVYLFVGRLVKDKGIEELVIAFNSMNISFKNIKLLLVGYREKDLDPLTSEIENIIDSNDNIIEVGHRRDVRSFYAIADVLTFPSYREGFPNVVLEAGSMGLPAIVSNINGCNEIIVHNKNGLIIPPKDSKELELQMINLLKDKNLHQKLASNCRQMIISRFDRQKFWAALLQEYRSLQL